MNAELADRALQWYTCITHSVRALACEDSTGLRDESQAIRAAASTTILTCCSQVHPFTDPPCLLAQQLAALMRLDMCWTHFTHGCSPGLQRHVLFSSAATHTFLIIIETVYDRNMSFKEAERPWVFLSFWHSWMRDFYISSFQPCCWYCL